MMSLFFQPLNRDGLWLGWPTECRGTNAISLRFSLRSLQLHFYPLGTLLWGLHTREVTEALWKRTQSHHTGEQGPLTFQPCQTLSQMQPLGWHQKRNWTTASQSWRTTSCFKMSSLGTVCYVAVELRETVCALILSQVLFQRLWDRFVLLDSIVLCDNVIPIHLTTDGHMGSFPLVWHVYKWCCYEHSINKSCDEIWPAFVFTV